MLFSERMGITSPKNVIQSHSMDEDLRNGLWNNLCILFLDRDKMQFSVGVAISKVPENSNEYKHLFEELFLNRLAISLWVDFLKRPLDIIRGDKWINVREVIRTLFFRSEWYEVYNFLEHVADFYKGTENRELMTRTIVFIDKCNSVLERELSAYRFINYKIVPITSEEEISSIEKALEDTRPINSVNIHLRTALELFADRKNPDYRNSIKESISAVEGLCGLIVEKPKTPLGDALKEIERKSKIQLHEALKKSFNNLYGYTSNADGIRHALLDEPNLDSEDAKFMLVSCSAFINYLIAKAAKAGIKL